MASSPPRKACEFCKQFATVMRNGWQLQDGTFSHLCDHCFSQYEGGTFCKVFHEQQDGWRNCVSCEEKFHCGCSMSNHMFEINDDATGICCKACLSGEWLVNVQVVLALPAAGAANADECHAEAHPLPAEES